jgi:hypothetical protein
MDAYEVIHWRREEMTFSSTFIALASSSMVPDSSTSSLNGNSLLVSIWNLVMSFITGIVNAIVGAASSVIYAMGSSFQQILFSWSSSAASYGLWGFLMAGISLVLTFFIVYFVMDFVGAEKDVEGLEEAL